MMIEHRDVDMVHSGCKHIKLVINYVLYIRSYQMSVMKANTGGILIPHDNFLAHLYLLQQIT